MEKLAYIAVDGHLVMGPLFDTQDQRFAARDLLASLGMFRFEVRSIIHWSPDDKFGTSGRRVLMEAAQGQ